MRAAVNVVALFCAVLALAVPGVATAEEDEKQAGFDRWVPSLGVKSGVTVQDWKASTTARMIQAEPVAVPNPTPGFLRPPTDGDDRDVTPLVGGNLELMSPELPIPTSPRVFVGGDMSANFGFERKVTRELDPDRAGFEAPTTGTVPFDEDTALGQGSEVVAETDNLTFGAYAGIAFPVEIFGRQLRIKPSVAWMHWEVDVEALLVDLECFTPGPPFLPLFSGADAISCNATGSERRQTLLFGKESESFDALGPGLDLEMDAARFGPIGTSLFVGARLYRVLGDNEVVIDLSQSFSDPFPSVPPRRPPLPPGGSPGSPGDRAVGRFTFEVDEWVYRVGVGVRFHWLGWKGAD